MSWLLTVISLLCGLRGDVWTDAFVIDSIAIPAGIDPQIGGLATMADGRLAVCFHRGEVMLYDPVNDVWSLFAEGLHEPLGILAEEDGSLLVMQRCELTRLRDEDGDGMADAYDCVCDGFGLTGNYHEFAFGPARDADGNLFIALNTASNGAGIRDEIRGEWKAVGLAREKMAVRGKDWGKVKVAAGRMYARTKWRGWVLKLSPDGQRVTPFACGFRSPDGIGFDAEGRLLVTDNQGDWLGTSKVHHVREGGFYGHVASLIWRDGWTENPLQMPVSELEALRIPAMALLPQGELANSPTQPIAVPEGVFGPFAGQTLIGEMNQKRLVRLLPDAVGDVSQGAVIPFLSCDALGAGNHRLAFTGDGSLWIGKTHLSWAGAEGLLRVRLRDDANALAVDSVRVQASGFSLHFSSPVDAATMGDVRVRSHTYKYHKAYGSPKVGEQQVALGAQRLDESGTTLQLELPELREGHVYTISLGKNVRARDGARLLGETVGCEFGSRHVTRPS